MDIGAYIAASGVIANQRCLENVTHNLANASTPGFKKLMDEMESVPFAFPGQRAGAKEALAFVRERAPSRNPLPGLLERTGRPLDVAIDGEGYFQLRRGARLVTTRDGRFRLDAGGTLVSREGFPVLGEDGKPIKVPRGREVVVSPGGEIRAGGVRVGRLRLVDAGGNPVEEGAGRICQGSLEGSNVDAVREMVEMMGLLRSHESYLKLIKGFDELEEKTVREMGRL